MLPSSLLVKPVSARCNLACGYCFYLGRSELYPERPKRMVDEVLEAMISQFMDICPTHASFSWQGGEPLLAGLDFYRRAVELQKAHGRGQVVSNAFQTNGTLLDGEWARFFHEYRFLVGISLDGPAHLHNIYRRTRSGKPTFEMVMRGIEHLRAGKVDFNVLSVVNDVTVSHPEEIYEFLLSEGIKYMQFVPCLELDPKADAPPPYNVDPEEYGEFLCRTFDLWRRDFPEVYVRLFNSVLAMRLGRPEGLCTLGPACGQYVVIEHNGDVYPCDFLVRPDTLLGNILETPLRRIVEGTRLLEFSRRKSTLPEECMECEWLDTCYGGCQYHRWDEGKRSRSEFCPAYRRFFEYSDEGFRELEARI